MSGDPGFSDLSTPFSDAGTGFSGAAPPPGLPTITSLSPSSGPNAGGTSVTITGTNLAGATLVVFGLLSAAIVSNTATRIVVTSPAAPAGTFRVAAQTPSGITAATPADLFTFTSTGPVGAATVTGISPMAGHATGGTTVTITVDDSTGITAVAFDGTPATSVTIIDGTTITAVSPSHAAGPADITVTNASGTSGLTPADVFTFLPPTPPLAHRWQILARDAAFSLKAEIEDFTASTFVINWNAVGTFTLTIPATSPAVPVLTGPQAGIVILCDGTIVFSGPIRDRIRASTGGLQTYTFSGVDDNFWLQARLAHMEPHSEAPPYDGEVYDTRTDVCSTVIGQYVAVNLGSSAIARRRIATLTVAPDPVVGSVVTGNARMQTVLALIGQLALASNPQLNFAIRQSGPALVFTVDVPTDRTKTVMFSAAVGTLGDFEYEQQASNANYIYVAGAGSGTGRKIAEGEDGTDINQWGLVEELLADASIDSAFAFGGAIVGELAAQAGVFRLDLSIIDTAGVAWPDDYDVGDKVSVTVDGIVLTELVRSLQVDLGPNGDTETIAPSVASPTPKTTVREQSLFTLVRSLQARITDLERNQ